ncbi:MAG: HIG1 domain-containing protein [Rhodospirillales bacterium]
MILPYLLGLTMLATVGVLFAGIVSFAFGRKGNARNATRLMAARVALQGLAVALFGVMVLASLG